MYNIGAKEQIQAIKSFRRKLIKRGQYVCTNEVIRIWIATGLHNQWRFAFKRNQSE